MVRLSFHALRSSRRFCHICVRYSPIWLYPQAYSIPKLVYTGNQTLFSPLTVTSPLKMEARIGSVRRQTNVRLAAAMLLTFYIADNALCGIKIVLQLIVAGAQIKAGLE